MLIKNKAALPYLLFIFWPFLALIYAVSNYKLPYSKHIVWLFCGFFGFTFVISGEGADSFVYSRYLKELHELNLTPFEFWEVLMNEDYSRGDYVEPILRYVVSIFTDDFRVLSAIFGLFFGYFYSENIFYVINKCGNNVSKSSLLYLIVFICLVPIWYINGFRYWAAAQVFFWGTSNFFIENKKIYILAVLSSILVHVGFLIPCGLVIVVWLVGKKRYLYLLLFVFTLFFANIDLLTLISFLPTTGLVGERIGGYTHPEVVENSILGLKANNWYLQLYADVIKYLAMFLAVYLVFFKKKILEKENLLLFMYLALTALSVGNILVIVPSFDRIFLLAYLIIFASFIVYLSKENNRYWVSRLHPIFTILMTFYLVVQIRAGFDYFGLYLFVFNVFTAPFFDFTTPLIDLIK